MVVAQVSSGAGIPLFLLILFGLPAARASFAVYVVVLFTTGATISWCAPLNQAIMAEITNEALRSTIYGLDRVLEGLFAPAGTALAGFLAEVAFGFRQSAACGDDAEAASGQAARGAAGESGDANAHALATSLADRGRTCAGWKRLQATGAFVVAAPEIQLRGRRCAWGERQRRRQRLPSDAMGRGRPRQGGGRGLQQSNES